MKTAKQMTVHLDQRFMIDSYHTWPGAERFTVDDDHLMVFGEDDGLLACYPKRVWVAFHFSAEDTA